MSLFKYSFLTTVDRDPNNDGGSNLIFDTERLITWRLGFDPAYPHNSYQAVSDPDCLVLSVSNSISGGEFPNIGGQLGQSERWLKVLVLNTRENFSIGPLPKWDVSDTDFILEPSFRLLSRKEKAIFKPDVKLARIQALPSRALPEVIAEAKDRYLSIPANREKISTSDLITAIVVGNLWSWPKMTEEVCVRKQVGKMKELLTRRGGQALLTTSLRTEEPYDSWASDLLCAELKPWIKDQYIWNKDYDKENPYLAFLGLADEIVVTGDSLSMVSDAAATGRPVRILHGWKEYQLKSRSRNEKIAFVSQMLAQGARNNLEEIEISDRCRFDTGVFESIEAVCDFMKERASKIHARITCG